MKNRKFLNFYFITLLLLIAVITIIIILAVVMLTKKGRIIVLIFSCLAYLTLFLFFITQSKRNREHIAQIQETFEFYSTKLMVDSGIGLIVFDVDSKIIWVSELITERFTKNLMGKNFTAISEKLIDLQVGNKNEVIFESNKLYYSAKIYYAKRTILISDITASHLANQYYDNEKLVLGIATIDSYNEYQVSLEEEMLFKIDIAVSKVLDYLVATYGVLYKKYGPGKFLLITNNQSLHDMESKNFSFVNKLQVASKELNVKISLSIGFGSGSSSFSVIEANSRSALLQSTSRGGDQITIVSSRRQNRYYGGASEALPNNSRVKIKMIAKRLSDCLSDKRIEKVIVCGHIQADLDALGAALGIVAIAKSNKKEVYIGNMTFDKTTNNAIETWLPHENSLFIKPSKARRIVDSKTVVVVVDTSASERIESIEAVKRADPENVFVFDHHRINNQIEFGHKEEQLYIDTAASSTCEIVTEILRFTTSTVIIPVAYAQFMLSGIYLDTNHFQKTTSSRTYNAAAWLEKKGAIPQKAVNILKLGEEETKIINRIEDSIQEIKPGFFLSVYDGELDSHIVAKSAEELLRTAGRKAAFIIAKVPGKSQYCMSARSINVNIQIIAELVGGGGHYSAAAAVTDESLETFRDNLIQAIVSVKENESNYN